MNKILLFLVAFSFLSVSAQSPTWSSEIAGIIYSKCTSCHRTGGIAPFALESYNDVIMHEGSINWSVSNDNMPPWPPDQTFSRFAHERSLNDQQKKDLLLWLTDGMPRGDISKEPPLPQFAVLGELSGTPDLTLSAPFFQIHASKDIYQCFVVKNQSTADKYIQALEVIPGNRNAVHHVLIYYDKSGEAKKLDDSTPEPGYISFGGIGVSGADLIGAWVPGTAPTQYPNGMGVKIPANGDIVLQVHYPAAADGQSDQTMLRIFYTKESQPRQVYISPILNHDVALVNGPLVIPANTVKSFTSEFVLNTFKVSLLSVAPHMHLLGKTIEVTATNSINETKNLIRINNWDFHWQGSYSYVKPVVLLPGTKLKAIATYDNTSDNPNNPNSPPKIVRLGEATTDEMLLVYFVFTLYQNGDENIVIDSSALLGTRPVFEDDSEQVKITKQGNNDYRIEITEDWLNARYELYDVAGKVLNTGILTSLSNMITHQSSTGVSIIHIHKPEKAFYKKVFLN
ncbi:MAG: hypothetical protein U0V49_14765 [Saprospiraceae bacterium]